MYFKNRLLMVKLQKGWSLKWRSLAYLKQDNEDFKITEDRIILYLHIAGGLEIYKIRFYSSFVKSPWIFFCARFHGFNRLSLSNHPPLSLSLVYLSLLSFSLFFFMILRNKWKFSRLQNWYRYGDRYSGKVVLIISISSDHCPIVYDLWLIYRVLNRFWKN